METFLITNFWLDYQLISYLRDIVKIEFFKEYKFNEVQKIDMKIPYLNEEFYYEIHFSREENKNEILFLPADIVILGRNKERSIQKKFDLFKKRYVENLNELETLKKYIQDSYEKRNYIKNLRSKLDDNEIVFTEEQAINLKVEEDKVEPIILEILNNYKQPEDLILLFATGDYLLVRKNKETELYEIVYIPEFKNFSSGA
jgi:hypothetical protein